MSSATFKPDYGIYLHSSGLMEGGSSTMPFLFEHIVSVDGGTFCASASSEQFCVTVDMDRDGLDQLVIACPAELASEILQGVRDHRGPGMIARFPEPIEMTVIGTLGPLQQTQTERFRPIMVEQITGPDGIVPASATLLLVELGLMLNACVEEDLMDSPLWQDINDRIRRINQRLDNQGGTELMQTVCSDAIGYLADLKVDGAMLTRQCIDALWNTEVIPDLTFFDPFADDEPADEQKS